MFQDLFRDTYRHILEIVDRYEISKGHNREVTAYLAFLTFAVLDDQAASLIPVRPDEFMYQRFRLYAGLSRSDVLNNWHCPDIPDMNDNPLFAAFIAFGDLLINSSARKDYHSASHAIHDLSETVLFTTSMIKQVFPITDRYIDRLITIREYTESSRRNPVSSQQIFYDRECAAAPRRTHRDSPSLSVQKDIARKEGRRNLLIGIVACSLIVAIVYFAFFSPSETLSSASSVNTSSDNPLSGWYYQLQEELLSPSSTLTPVTTYNGKRIILPDYIGTCPFSITADSKSDYYIYLDYSHTPSNSQERRQLKSTAASPYENDIAFIVKAGQTVSIDVPVGVYALYYATGKTFYGTQYLFGDETRYYKADKHLSFYLSGDYYNGHSITLYATYDGNFETDEISDKSFPTR